MIYILLAAFNEEKNLPFIFKDIQQQEFNFSYKIILVNDGSTDNTHPVAKGFQNTLPITILDHSINQGLGIALSTGFGFISGKLEKDDAVVTLDSDNTHPARLIKQMKDKIDSGNELVIASRYIKGGGQSGLSIFRMFLSRSAGIFLKCVWPIKGVLDYSCGYRMYSANLINKLFRDYGEGFISEKGFSATLEILLKASMYTDMAVEVPLKLDYSKKIGKSKMKVFKTIFRYFVLLFKLKIGKQPAVRSYSSI